MQPQPQAMQIRPFVEDDGTAVVALWQDCALTRPWNDPLRDIARKLSVQRDLFLVGACGGRLMASVMAGFDGHRGWVNYLAVHPGFRRQGHGEALMHRVEQLLLGIGCPKLNLQVRSGNASVLAFYAALGYAPDDVVSLGKRLISDQDINPA